MRPGRRLRVSDRLKLENEIARAQRNFEQWRVRLVELEARRHRARTRAEVAALTEQIAQADAAYRDAALTWRYLTTLLDDTPGESP